MSVRNGFMIEIYGFTHSLHTFLAWPLMVSSQWRTQRIEDDSRLENESRDIEDG